MYPVVVGNNNSIPVTVSRMYICVLRTTVLPGRPSICRFPAFTTAHQLIKFQTGLSWGARMKVEIKAALVGTWIFLIWSKRSWEQKKIQVTQRFSDAIADASDVHQGNLYSVRISYHRLTPGLVVYCWLRTCRTPSVRPVLILRHQIRPSGSPVPRICKRLTFNAHKNSASLELDAALFSSFDRLSLLKAISARGVAFSQCLNPTIRSR